MTMLFGAMLPALGTVYDKESGVMRMMLVAPLPRAWLVIAKLVAAAAAALAQALLLLILLALLGYVGRGAHWGLLAAALVATSCVCAGIGMLTASFSRTLENFAGIMNFVIFPAYFASSALYPLWFIQQGSPPLYKICLVNPFTHAVELIRFAFYGELNWLSLGVVAGYTIVFLAGAIFAYDPSRGLMTRKQDRGGNG
jgi:ABC-2 type transport system permease protein